VERRLSAILAADVAGYSRLMGEDEAATLERLKVIYSSIVQPSIAQRRGRVVKLMGDGLLAEFASTVESVLCAVDIQQTLSINQAEYDVSKRIQLRVGVNLGDIIVEGSDIFGDGVNVAARLEAIAEPGGLCISGTVFDTTEGKLEVQFRDIGLQRFKNISRPVRAYRLETVQQAPTPQRATRLPRPDKPSIAVLPFADKEGDTSHDYLAEGISEDIITELSRFSGLFVIARNSSFAYRQGEQGLEQIARELGVRYVLQGTIRRSGKRLRISAQLLDSEDGSQVWGEKFDCDAAHVFDLQDDITRKAVGSIAPQIELAELTRNRSLTGAGLSAYELAFKGQALAYEALRAADPVTLRTALKTVNEALELDPVNQHALWTRCLCLIYQHMYHWGDNVDALLDTVSETTDLLFKTDGANAKAYMVRAWVRLYQGRFDAALADHQRSLELNPNLAMNLFAMSWTEAVIGLTEEARTHAQMALRLSPREADVWLGEGYAAIAMASLLEGKYAEAIRWGNLAYQRQPALQTLLVAANFKLGDFQSALHHLKMLQGFAPQFIKSVIVGTMMICKRPEHNEMLIDALRQASDRSAQWPYD
jgi:TolB-like protein